MGARPYVPMPYRSRHFPPWRGRHLPGSANVHASGGARGNPPRGPSSSLHDARRRRTSSLLSACHRLGVAATIADSEEVRLRAREDDIALARLDVRPTLDGVEAGLWELRRLGRQRVRVLNEPGALFTVHDKLATALRLAAHWIPHPRTAHLDRDGGLPPVELPVVANLVSEAGVGRRPRQDGARARGGAAPLGEGGFSSRGRSCRSSCRRAATTFASSSSAAR
jgi:hypothetical protein